MLAHAYMTAWEAALYLIIGQLVEQQGGAFKKDPGRVVISGAPF